MIALVSFLFPLAWYGTFCLGRALAEWKNDSDREFLVSRGWSFVEFGSYRTENWLEPDGKSYLYKHDLKDAVKLQRQRDKIEKMQAKAAVQQKPEMPNIYN